MPTREPAPIDPGDPDFTITFEASAPEADPIDPIAVLGQLGAKWSPALTRPGPLVITSRDCVLCGPDQDCDCADTPMGSEGWIAKMERVHGRSFR